MSSPEVLDLSLAGYAALVARSGVDPDAEVRRFAGTDPGAVYDASSGFGNAARGMEQAWTSSWDSQAVLAESYTVDGAPVRDRATHEATLPAGFRGASEQLGVTSTRGGAVATSLGWESALARSRLRTLHGDVTERAAAWARDVADAGLIAPEQTQEWLDARTRVEQQIITMITDAHGVITGSERMNRSAVPEPLDVDSTSAGFTNPRELVRAVELGITNLEPWWILTGSELRERAAGLAQRYPALADVLVPFAWRQDNDDIACCDATGEIVTVHDYATPDWAVRPRRHPDFGEWLKQAVQDHLDFGC